MATEKTLTSLVINKIDSQETYNKMKAQGLINADELYLTPEISSGGGSNQANSYNFLWTCSVPTTQVTMAGTNISNWQLQKIFKNGEEANQFDETFNLNSNQVVANVQFANATIPMSIMLNSNNQYVFTTLVPVLSQQAYVYVQITTNTTLLPTINPQAIQIINTGFQPSV